MQCCEAVESMVLKTRGQAVEAGDLGVKEGQIRHSSPDGNRFDNGKKQLLHSYLKPPFVKTTISPLTTK